MSEEQKQDVTAFFGSKLEVLNEALTKVAREMKDTLDAAERERLQIRIDFIEALVLLAQAAINDEIETAILIIDSNNKLSTQAYPATPLPTVVGLLELSKNSLMQPQPPRMQQPEPVEEGGSEPVEENGYLEPG